MDTNETVIPVILSGGSGTRLWPASRERYPKQLMPLLSDRSLFQETVLRATGPGFAAPIVVCSEEHRFVVADQLRALDVTPQAIILEPVGRNTAPAVAAAAFVARDLDPGATLLVLPSDHVIDDVPSFHRAVDVATAAACQGWLVTFGITPEYAATGYGWIKPDRSVGHVPAASIIQRFVEKPDATTARRMYRDGGWLWNSGMFLFRAGPVLEELVRFEPETAMRVSRAVNDAEVDLGFLRLAADDFAAASSIALDHAVMERTIRACVVPATLGWSDVGTWEALWDRGHKDLTGNSTVGDVVSIESSGCYLRGDGPLVATLGVSDLVVVSSPDAVLVADRRRAQDVGELVRLMKHQGRPEATTHRIVHRPWGTYECLDTRPGFQVKRINVKPGHQLSLQKHEHRAEHWVVVSGRAQVVRGEDSLVLEANMSIDIPAGCAHRLGNAEEQEVLQLIEVQTGSYLGEDDIVRLEDAYGRAPSVPAQSAPTQASAEVRQEQQPDESSAGKASVR